MLRKVRKKRRAWKKFKKSSNIKDFELYKEAEKSVKSSVKRAKKVYEKDLSKKKGDNNKAFNNYLKSRLSSKCEIGPLVDANGKITNDDNDMANILNEYFSSVFSCDNDVNQNCDSNDNNTDVAIMGDSNISFICWLFSKLAL